MKRLLVLIVAVVLAAIAAVAAWQFRERTLVDTVSLPSELPSDPQAPMTTAPDPPTRGTPTEVSVTTFETSTDYAKLLATALPAAEAGDVAAMDTVAKILAYCTFYSLS